MTALNHYIKIKDKICVYHEGHTPEYLVQLRLLIPSFQLQYPAVQLSYACRELYLHWLSPYSRTMKLEEFFDNKNEFALNLSISYDAVRQIHPILDFVKKAEIKKYPVGPPANHFGVICPEGNYPTESLDVRQIQHLRSWVQSRGFRPLVVGTAISETLLPIDKRPSPMERQKLAREAGFVVGVECDMLYEAVGANIPTALVPTGLGEELYKGLCEKPVILSV